MGQGLSQDVNANATETAHDEADAAGELVLRSEPRPGVVQLTLSRPAKLNALTWPLVEALQAQLRALADDLSCRVVVLTGAGRGFRAGLHLAGLGAGPGPLARPAGGSPPGTSPTAAAPTGAPPPSTAPPRAPASPSRAPATSAW